jgi:hypothetical protein
MRSSPIQNALLRIDDARGEPPAPFMRGNEAMDFWVLELRSQQGDGVTRWCSRVAKLLKEQARTLARLRKKGASLTLFVELSVTEPVLRLEADFLKMLAEMGVSVEFSKAAE